MTTRSSGAPEVRVARLPMLLIALALSATVGCWTIPRSATPAQIVGTYSVHYGFGEEELVLRADGTFTQTLHRADGRSVVNDGHWELVRQGAMLRLKNALNFEGEFGAEEKELTPHERDLTVGTVWGTMALDFNPDRAPYERVHR